MSEKGNAYLPTRWEYGERPVTAAKLNGWDDHIAAALELAYRLINENYGGGDGVLQNTLDALQVAARTPPGMTVNVLTGIAFISNMPLALYQNVELLPITAPTTHPRIDLVQAGLSDWSFTIREGEEAAVPIPPEPDEDSLPLARIHLRPGMTSIKNSDDGINGYIEDTRTLL